MCVCMYMCVSVFVCIHVPTRFGARGSCVVTVRKLVPASNFVRQSRSKRLMGKFSVGGPGRNVSCLHCHGDPASESKLDGSHPVPVILMGGDEKQPQLLRGRITLKVGRGWEESKRQMRGEPIGELGSSWDLPGLGSICLTGQEEEGWEVGNE